jgi:hypothetical protein
MNIPYKHTPAVVYEAEIGVPSWKTLVLSICATIPTSSFFLSILAGYMASAQARAERGEFEGSGVPNVASWLTRMVRFEKRRTAIDVTVEVGGEE